ncbi:peptide ABC transporter ATP-binding protein [Bacteroidota bacterium]|nr:peptide ABC transporter ATP-binding protein [Bacteroidota bacterium]
MGFNLKNEVVSPILTVDNLSIFLKKDKENLLLLHPLSFTISQNERVGLVGPSGSGKSITMKAILGILPENLFISQNTPIIFHENGNANVVSFIPQNAQLNLNPLITCGNQLLEVVNLVCKLSTKREKYDQCIDWLEKVGLSDAVRIFNSYPHELSGGQLQRITIAMALIQKPSLILADEPTTALDPILQHQVLTLLFTLADSIQAGVLIISHDVHLISKWTNKLIYLDKGKKVDYISPYQLNPTEQIKVDDSKETLLSIKNVSVKFKKGLFRPTYFTALSDICLSINKGECVGVIGVSGSGKSTLAKFICGLIPQYDGTINFTNPKDKVQMIFQNPFLSLNPKFRVVETLISSLKTIKNKHLLNRQNLIEILDLVGLDESFLSKFPQECSGGEQQRIAIARAICVNPSLLILDESLASLDIERQFSIVNLLYELKQKLNISMLFISHDINMVMAVSDYIYVLSSGSVVESGKTSELRYYPKNEVTKRLLSHF